MPSTVINSPRFTRLLLHPFTLSRAPVLIAVVTALLILLPADIVALSTLSVGSLRCEMRENPVGIDATTPRLSWVPTSSARNQRQSAYQILAATSTTLLLQGKADLWDSGRHESDQSFLVEYRGRPLESNQQVYWTVCTWDVKGDPSEWAAPASWTMGLLAASDWKADWIATSEGSSAEQQPIQKNHPPLPLLRKEFAAARSVRRAVVHVSGLGQYKLFLNGRPVGDHFLDPAWSQYERTRYYNSFDVTQMLAQGPNAFGVMLGKGPYNTRGDRRIHGNQNDFPLKLILQALIEYDDGSTETVKTDASWKWKAGPLIHDSILGGCDYDARAWPQGWAKAGFDDAAWIPAVKVPSPPAALSVAFSPPMRMQEEFPPASVDESASGHFVYDFGQNASATPRLRVKGPAGTSIRLTYAEQRAGSTPSHNDGHGRVDQSGMHSPNYIEYTLRGDGKEEEWTPPFFYTGYQYLELTGGVPRGFPNPDGKPVVTSLVSIHVRADVQPIGSFSCSDREVNGIDRMIDWSVRSNLGHVLTDCPHREKLGWLEVPWLMWASIAYRYDLSSYGPKICRDIREAQRDDGQILTVAPSYPRFKDGFHYTPEWGAAGVFVPWYVYQWYGDRRTLERSYASMKRFVDYMHGTSNQLVPKPGLGDWYDYGHGQPLGASRFTPVELSAMAVFAGCAQTVSRAAKVLGKTDDATTYADLAQRIAAEFNRRYFEGKGEYRNSGSPQTANAMALAFGLVQPAQVKPVVEGVVADLESREWQQTSGDVGYRFLLRALADHDRSDAIFAMLRRDQLGSYRFLRNAGWTSLPESWNAFRSYSMNHCMLGHIQEWFVHDLAGIQPVDGVPAFRTFRICPVVDGDITSASASFRSPYGDIVSRWERSAGKLTLDVTIPVSTTAQVCIPAASADQVIEGGRHAAQSEGVKFDRMEQGRAVLAVGSGTYRFEAPLRSE